MLEHIYQNRLSHTALVLLTLLVSFALSLLAVFGTIFHSIFYLTYLPIAFMLFMSGLFGILILADKEIQSRKAKTFFSIEASSLLFAILLIPLAVYFVNHGGI